MKNRKGRSRFFSLPEKTPKKVQVESLKKEFELAEKSVRGKAIASKFQEVAKKEEEKENINRIKPGELLVEFNHDSFSLPLIDKKRIDFLAKGGSYSAYKDNLRLKQFDILKEHDQDVSLNDLFSLLDHSRLATISSFESVKELLPESKTEKDPGIVNPNQAGAQIKKRSIPDRIEPLPKVKEKMIPFAEKYGLRPTLTEAMLSSLQSMREYLKPRLKELKPGQAVWLARDVNYKPRWGKPTADCLQPVIITLFTEEELGKPPQSKEVLKKQELKRLARITSEAYLQDGVFTTVDLEMLMNRSIPYISKLLDIYKKHYQKWLPTAGTILDVGRCITHKKEAVELALAGYNTKKVARKLFHTTEAIDRYLDQFEKVALLNLKYEVPDFTIAYTLNCSESLVKEYLDIVKEHEHQLPDVETLEQRLKENGHFSHGA
ncbi:MAG: DUF1670 domain-containing protein [Bacillota bacterium]